MSKTHSTNRPAIKQLDRPDNHDQTTGHSYHQNDAWFTGVGTSIYFDRDLDGFFTGLNISFDMATSHTEIDIICVVSLISDDYTFEPFHTTNTLTIGRYNGSNQHHVELQLLDGIPTDRYDIKLTLRDPWTHRQLDQISADHHSNLHRLPLESESGDSSEWSDDHHSTNAHIQYSATVYGGSLDTLALLFLLVAGWLHHRYRR